MKKNKIKYMLLFAVCLMMLSFAGCKAGQDEEVSLAEGQNALYFLSSEEAVARQPLYRISCLASRFLLQPGCLTQSYLLYCRVVKISRIFRRLI